MYKVKFAYTDDDEDEDNNRWEAKNKQIKR